MSFASLGVAPELLRAVTEQGYTEPTPVQLHAIPVILQGGDVMAGAQTGTGKTAGFTLPLLQRLSMHANTSASPARHPIRALILVPTRELAAQVEDAVCTYGKYTGLRSAVVFGGVGIDAQIAALRSGVEVLVATPGRLLDHVQQKTVNLSKVEILVLDEADRMLDMGFIRDIQKILALLPLKRQNLMFSATFSEDIKALADGMLHNPALIEVARRNAPTDLVTHVVHPVDHDRKLELLVHLAKIHDLRQALVFTRTKHMASRLAHQLEREGIAVTAIHSDKTQPARTKALEDFKAGMITMLVATDIAARGLDIEELPHVINYELPHTPGDYIHRIGRTGRAGIEGDAISLVSKDELEMLADIEKLLKRKLPKEIIPGFEPDSKAREPVQAARGRPTRQATSRSSSAPSSTDGSRPKRERDERPQGRRPPLRQPMSEDFARLINEPYSPQEPSQAASPAHERKRSTRPVAVLLGGGKRSET